MADNSPLLKISSNLEISQSNRKNVPTENESYSMTGCPDEKPSEILPRKSMAETEIERDTQVTENQNEECLQAEKVIKALLSIRGENQNDKATIDLHASASPVRASQSSTFSEPRMEKNHGSNSDDTASSPSVVNDKKKRRRRRRTRKRKVKDKDTNELSTTDLEARSTTTPIESPSSATCSSSVECAELIQNVGRGDLSVELIKASDSAISQDDTYQDLITEEFAVDYEQRMIKENLFFEHEKLAKEVSRFELELNAQLEKSEATKQSLQELKTSNELLEQEKTDLLDNIKSKEDEIVSLKEQASSLKMICDELWIWKNESEEKTSYIELDNLKSQLIYKEDELEFAKTKHKNECIELTKNHGSYLTEILAEAHEINMTLYTALNSGETKPEIYKTRNVLQLLKLLKEDVLTLSDKSSALELNVKLLRKEIDSQTRMMTKLANDKKLLKEEVVQVSNKNKEFVKEKAKLERDKQTLKAEGVRAKSAAQTFKARVEELKASSRSAKRENEIAQREKQNIETVLKNLGFDYNSLMLNHKSKMDTQNNKQENPRGNFHNLAANLAAKLQGMVVNTAMKDESLTSAQGEVKTMLDVKGLDAATNGVLREQTCSLNHIFARITKHGFCLKKILELKSDLTNIEMLFQSLYCDCGCHKDRMVVKKVSENFPELFRCLGSFGTEKVSKKKINEEMSDLNSEADDNATENFRDELEKLKAENRSLKLEQIKQEKSLENYKEMVRGYSHIVQDLEDRVADAREMRYINCELERYSVLLGQQKFYQGFQLVKGPHEGINLIHAMFQRLKNIAGNPIKSDTSVPSSEPVPMKSIKEMNKCMKENLACNEHNLSQLKKTLAKKRKEAEEIGIRIDVALLGREQSLFVEPLSRAEKSKVKGPLHMGFNSRVSENGNSFGNVFGSNLSTLLSEEMLAVVINLVQRKEQLLFGIEESVELERKLDKLGESYREYMDVLERKCFSSGESKWSPNATVESKDFKLEKERNENEFYFKEARIGLLEKQIAQLKSERQACLKALDRYEEAMEADSASKRMASALARALLPPNVLKEAGLKCDLQGENVFVAAKDCVYKGKTVRFGPFGNGQRFTMAGSNV